MTGFYGFVENVNVILGSKETQIQWFMFFILCSISFLNLCLATVGKGGNGLQLEKKIAKSSKNFLANILKSCVCDLEDFEHLFRYFNLKKKSTLKL